MHESPLAWIVSDFPISAQTIAGLLDPRFHVYRTTWRDAREAAPGATLIVLDVTGVGADEAISLISQLPGPAVLAVASLDRNEVSVYDLHHHVLSRRAELPSLLALAV